MWLIVQFSSSLLIIQSSRRRLTGGIALQGHYSLESSQTRLVVVFCAQLFKGARPDCIDFCAVLACGSAWLVASSFLVEPGLFSKTHDFQILKYQLLRFLV